MAHEQTETAHARVGRFLAALAEREPTRTHLSEVFVGPDSVWKRKQPVRLPFIDLTDLAARHRCLERELELNGPRAPGLYRDVVAVVEQADGRLDFAAAPPAGAALDWVLRMARIAEHDLLDARAEAGKIDHLMLASLGDMVADLHQGLAPVVGWDSAAAMRRLIEGNAEAARAAGLPPDLVNRWRDECEQVRAASLAWFAGRWASGFVRRAHGDLHLGNICVWGGRVVPFDALEFDEALATIDVGYDLAFLLMDLDRRVGREAANRVMNRYVARTGDAGLTGGLRLFLSQRAMVRAHVQARVGASELAYAYLHAALDYLVESVAVVLAIGGLPGCGKSTIARGLAPQLGNAPGALVVRSDEVRKRLHGVLPEQRLPPEAYAPQANARTNAAVLTEVIAAASGGQAVIADATFLDPAQREAIRDACAKAGIAFRGVWLDAPLDILLARVRARHGDASDATEEVLRRAAAQQTQDVEWPIVATG